MTAVNTALTKGASFVVALALSLGLLICIGGIIALALSSKDVPSELTTATGMTLTGLLGLLGRSPNEAQAQPVIVQNPPAQPVPVDPQ